MKGKTLQDVLNESEERFKRAAMDEDGDCYIYNNHTGITEDFWEMEDYQEVTYLVDIKPSNWKTSLVERQYKKENIIMSNMYELRQQQEELMRKAQEIIDEAKGIGSTIKKMEEVGDIEGKVKKQFNRVSLLNSFTTNELEILGYNYSMVFKSDSDYQRFLVERVIEYVIAEYNDGWELAKDRSNLCGTRYLASGSNKSFGVNAHTYTLMCKPYLVIKDGVIASKVIKALENFNGKNFLKYYFTNEW